MDAQTKQPEVVESEKAALAGGITLIVRTMGGAEHRLENLDENTKLEEVKLELCRRMSAPPFCVRLVINGVLVERFLQTLTEAGLVEPDASLVLIRIPGENVAWRDLFQELLSAFYKGHCTEVQRLVDLGAGFDSDGNLLKQDFHRGSESSCKVACMESSGSTMLHLAVRHNLTDLALQLIAHGADVNVPNEHGRTALIQAAIKQNDELLDALLLAEADPFVADRDKRYAYSYAIGKGNDKMAAKLLAAGYSPSSSDHVEDGDILAEARKSIVHLNAKQGMFGSVNCIVM